ncbi:MAG TPA: hypothetical protein VHO24_18720 [Opitutaceae bacterium]|nr:hypothetical protein [Opitutaceae bacterium]
MELLRWVVVVAGTLVLHRPLMTSGSVGAGDAYWYNIMVADFISQWREGIFPVFVGQTEFAFNGAISPLRFAPGLQHLAGVIDLLTLHSLSFHGILNFTLVACYVAGALTCYGCLRAIDPQRASLALIFTWLFTACPALLALAYTGDLFMSITAVPFVPLLLYGAWRTLTDKSFSGLVVMVSAAAALWYFHPPIALWGTIIAGVTQIVRLRREGGDKRVWFHWAGGALIFIALSTYCFVSVKSTGIPAYPIYRPGLINVLREAFPAAFFPVSETAVAITDYQLGWALWGLLIAAIVALFFSGNRRTGLVFLGASLMLIAFLLPTPWLLRKLWMSVPQMICDITFIWPMQRLYVWLAGLSVFAAFLTVGAFDKFRGWHPVGFVLLCASSIWSARESAKFHNHAFLTTTPPSHAAHMLFPQNRILTRYAFNPFRSIPPYISHGYIDPLVPNRVLALETFAELASNGGALENDPEIGVVRSEGTLLARRADPSQPSLAIEPNLHLEPHRRYVLKFDFAHPDFIGGLKLTGQRVSRFYWMPDSAYDTKPIVPSQAFGTSPGRPHSITLWTDGDKPENIRMEFFFTAEAPASEVKVFGRYKLTEFDPLKLPVKIESWAPYRAQVSTAVPAHLETPRMFLEGYRARVNGKSVKVARSPSALVMVPLSPGENRVEVFYPGTLALRCTYFFSVLAWAVLLLVWLACAWRNRSKGEARVGRTPSPQR